MKRYCKGPGFSCAELKLLCARIGIQNRHGALKSASFNSIVFLPPRLPPGPGGLNPVANEKRQLKKTSHGEGGSQESQNIWLFLLFLFVVLSRFLFGDHHAGVQPRVSDVFFKYVVCQGLFGAVLDGAGHVRVQQTAV